MADYKIYIGVVSLLCTQSVSKPTISFSVVSFQ